MSYIFVLVAVVYVIRLLIGLSNRQSPHTPPGFEEVASRPARSAEDDASLIRKDLGRLDAVQPGLGQEAVRYVLKGDNDSVMLKLGQHQTAVAQALRQNSWSMYGSWMSGRADFLVAASEWRPKAVRRYGEILDFIHVGASWIRLPASDKSPRWFRALLYEYGQARAAALNKHTTWKVAPPAKAKQPWSIDRLIELLGEDLAPILDAAFTHDEGYGRSYTEPGSPEQMSGFEAHLRSDPDRRIAELRPLGAKARSGALRKFAQMKLVDGPYFDFAFSQASDSAKSVREGAALLLRAARPDLLLQRTGEAWPTLKAAQKGELASVRLGYNRGAAEDGGVFMTYEKPFDALKLVAVVEFTGNGLPEENRPSALVALRFVRQKKAGGFLNWSSGVPMKDVPAVLLSEAWNDFHTMAAAGSGFDAEWEKKAGW